MAVSVTDIGENTKLAREMSLLGNYETARNILKLSEPSLFLENQSCHMSYYSLRSSCVYLLGSVDKQRFVSYIDVD